jgi:Right handed beta helix region
VCSSPERRHPGQRAHERQPARRGDDHRTRERTRLRRAGDGEGRDVRGRAAQRHLGGRRRRRHDRLERHITGAGSAATGSDSGPWAGIDVEPDVPTYPIAQLTITGNSISSNRGSGILLALATDAGLPAVADGIAITNNRITRNASSHGPFLRGGICLQGGQSGGRGHLSVSGNTITYNGGYGLCKDPAGYRMQITLGPNTIYGNESGNSQW